MPAIELDEPYVEPPKQQQEFPFAWIQQLNIRMMIPGGESSVQFEFVPMNANYQLPTPIPQATIFTFSDIQALRLQVPELDAAYLAIIAAIPAMIEWQKSQQQIEK